MAAAGREGRVGDALSFSGPLPAQDLSDELAACDLLLFADDPGPSSRKGTLAASLASARPVIAIDGPQGWSELAEAGAVRVVPADPHRRWPTPSPSCSSMRPSARRWARAGASSPSGGWGRLAAQPWRAAFCATRSGGRDRRPRRVSGGSP